MNNPVSGESSAKGFSVIIPYIAVGPAAVAIRRRNFGTLGMWQGRVRQGVARLGVAGARQGFWRGGASLGAA